MAGSPKPQLPSQAIDSRLLDSILSSPQFARSQRLCRFLKLLAERANQQNAEPLKETEIGVLVFDREVGYDPKIDSIVRTEASRLRKKLSEYYGGEGRDSAQRLHLPVGRYELEAHANLQPVQAGAPVETAAPVRKFPYAVPVGTLTVIAAVAAWVVSSRSPVIPVLIPLTRLPRHRNSRIVRAG